MATEKQETHESEIGLTKERSSQQSSTEATLDSSTCNSLGSVSSTDANHAIIIIDEETLEPKKKPKLGSWWDDVEVFNELNSVVKGLLKSEARSGNDVVSRVDSSVSSTYLHEKKTKRDDERSLSSNHHHDNFGESKATSSNKGNYGHVSLEELGVKVEDLKSMPWEAFDPTWEIRSETMDPWLGGYIKDIKSPDH